MSKINHVIELTFSWFVLLGESAIILMKCKNKFLKRQIKTSNNNSIFLKNISSTTEFLTDFNLNNFYKNNLKD